MPRDSRSLQSDTQGGGAEEEAGDEWPANHQPISPPEGEMPGRAEGGWRGDAAMVHVWFGEELAAQYGGNATYCVFSIR
jgi:hypothetical protein